MAAKIGILGETTQTTTGTITVYTVPGDKAARIRVLFMAEVTSDDMQYAVLIGSPGTESHLTSDIATNTDFWTGIVNGASRSSSAVGVHEADIGQALAASSGDKGALVPWPHDFYLSTGDTVRVIIAAGTFQDHLFQVIGVEDDA